MANEQLVNYLEALGPNSATGIFEVYRNDGSDNGSICLSDGDIVYAETQMMKDLPAVFVMLAWANAVVKWVPDTPPSKMSCHHETSLVLFEFVQLEDLLVTEEAIVNHLMDESNSRKLKRKTVLLPDLKKYSICLEGVDEYSHLNYELVEGVLFIGNSTDCHIQINDPTISRKHCQAIVTKTSITLTDLGSTNGSFVNGKIIEQAVILPGDIVNFGQVSFKLTAKMQRKLARQTSSIAEPPQEKKKKVPPPSEEITPEGDMTKVIHWKDIAAAQEKVKSKGFLGRFMGK